MDTRKLASIDTRLLRRPNSAGFSLLELMVTLSIAAILLAVGIPSFQNFTADSCRSAVSNDLLLAMQLARSETEKSGKNYVACGSKDLASCEGGLADWNTGWIVFQDDDGDTNVDPTELIVQAGSKQDCSQSLEANRIKFSFRPFGRQATGGTIKVCDARGSDKSRAVIVSLSGRARVAETLSDGSAVLCS